MRVSLPVRLPARRPPTLIEQLLGKQRARWLRRRMGFLALGASYSLLKPRYPWKPIVVGTSLVVLAVAVVR